MKMIKFSKVPPQVSLTPKCLNLDLLDVYQHFLKELRSSKIKMFRVNGIIVNPGSNRCIRETLDKAL